MAPRGNKAVNQFLGTQAGYLDDIADQITDGRIERRLVRETNRAAGTGPWLGKGPAGMGPVNPAFLNPQPGPLGQAAMGPQPLALNAGPQPPRPAIGPGTPGMAPGMAPAPAPAAPINVGQVTHTPQRPVGLGAGAAGNPVNSMAAQAAAGQAAGAGAAGAGAGGGGRGVGNSGRPGGGFVRPGGGTGGGQNIASRFGNFTKGGLFRGAGVAGAGMALSGVVDNFDIGGENSAIDRAASGGVLGAGIGGGVGMALGLAGPKGWAAAAGGALIIGGAKHLFGEKRPTIEQMHGDVDTTRQSILELGNMYGLEGDALGDILLQWDAGTRMFLDSKDKDGLANYTAQMSQQLPMLMLQQKQIQDQDRKENERYESMIGMQAQFAPMFGRQMDRASEASQMAHATSGQAASMVQERHPQLAALMRTSSANNLAASEQLYTSYAAQMAMGPQRAADTQDLENRLMQEEIARQAMQPAY